MSRSTLGRNAERLGRPEAPVPDVRISWSSSWSNPLDHREGALCISCTIAEAVRAGAGAAQKRHGLG